MLFRSLKTAALLAASVVAAIPLQPSEDPFYQPPAGFETTEPGTILRNRTIVPAFLGLILDPVETWQVLYRTTAINGTPIATVTTIFKPAGAALDKFVSFHTAEDSSYVNCAPSYNYQLLAEQTNAIVSAEFLVIQAYLASGYVVSSPDYESFDAAFGPGHLEGMGVLDSMRAVNNYAPTLGLKSSNNSIVGVGYSGGAIATGWAAALQSIYAPELAIKGWAAGGTPANLTGTALFLSNTTFAGFVPAAFDGLAKPNAYGAVLEPVYDQYITPYGQSILDYANENCGTSVLFVFAGKSVFSYDFQTLGLEILQEPHVATVLQQNILGINETEVPIAPVYLYHSVTDEIIPYSNASTLYDNWCSQGADVQFTTFGSGGHLTTEIYGLPGTLDFVKSAFAGTVPKACSKKTILDNVLDPLALLSDLEPILIALLNGLLQLQNADSGNLTAINQPVAV